MNKREYCAACDRELSGLGIYDLVDTDGSVYCEDCWSQMEED